MGVTYYRMDGTKMTPEEVKALKEEDEVIRKQRIKDKGHDCEDQKNALLITKGHSIDWYCKLCGDLVSAG